MSGNKASLTAPAPFQVAPPVVVPPAAVNTSWPSIPGYDLICEVGRGGMSTVYRAHKRSLGRDVAIKVIRRQDGAEDDTLRRFCREARAAACLSHPNIVTVYDAGATETVLYLVMEYVKGVDLQRLVDRSGALFVEAACDFVRQAALGLQHAHEHGMVHRDIKPGNLILVETNPKDKDAGPIQGRFGHIKLVDFGLARLVHPDEMDNSGSPLTQEGTIVGTPDFMAPEQVEHSHDVDIRADLYSLGCTFFYLLTGQVPFNARTVLEKLDQHRWRPPRRVARLRRGIPPPVSDIVQKLMAKDRAERYQTPQELIDALAGVARSMHRRAAGDPQPRKKVETEMDIFLDALEVPGEQVIERELDKLQQALAERLEHDDLAGALQLTDAMMRIKPDDSLTLAARTFIREQLDRSTPVGEQSRLELPEKVQGVTVSPDGSKLAAAAGTRVYVVDVARNSVIHALAGHSDEVRDVAFSPDGLQLLSASNDHTIRLWDVRSGHSLAKFHQHTAGVNGVVWLPSGQEFLSAGADKAIFIWDVTTGHRRCKIRNHTGDVKGIARSADGRTALSASWDHTLRLWNLQTGTEQQRMGGGLSYFNCAALSSDGQLALGAGSDNIIHLYLTETGKEQRAFEGHSKPVMSVAFSPDGRKVLSSGDDGDVRVWNRETGSLLGSFKGHNGSVPSVAFFPDGRRALSGGADRTLRVWRLPR